MLRPKPNIQQISPAVHGGVNYPELARRGIAPEKVLDFSVSTNPFGPPPGIPEAMCGANIERYPDSEATGMRQALAGKLNISPESIIVGNGSTELIRMTALAYLGTGDRVIIPRPTYSDYEVACRLVGAEVIYQSVGESSDFRLDTGETIALIKRHRAKGVFLCNPNNPTGDYLSRADIEKLLDGVPDCLVVLDEAYIAFTRDAWSSLDLVAGGNLIIVRSMTKDYALAGLRLGYVVADEPVVTVLKKVRPPWNVSSVAQAAGVFALRADGYLAECSRKIIEAKDFLVEELSRLGLSPRPSRANFFLVPVKDAGGLRNALLGKGILVRDCSSFGLPRYIRLAPRTLAECRQLIEAVKTPEVFRYAR